MNSTFTPRILSYEGFFDKSQEKRQRIFFSPSENPSFPCTTNIFRVSAEMDPIVGSIFLVPESDISRIIALNKAFTDIHEIGSQDDKCVFTPNDAYNFSSLIPAEGYKDNILPSVPSWVRKIRFFSGKRYCLPGAIGKFPRNDNLRL